MRDRGPMPADDETPAKVPERDRGRDAEPTPVRDPGPMQPGAEAAAPPPLGSRQAGGGAGSTPLARVERQRRVRVSVEVGLHTTTNFFVGSSLNLSEGGLFVATSAELQVGTQIELQFALPSGLRLQVNGVIRWRRGADERAPLLKPGLGIQFVDLSEEGLEGVRRFVEQREPMRRDEE